MQPPGKLSGAREISEHEVIPHSFLSKVLLPLRRGRLLRSVKGIRGGYELAMPPQQISLLTVVRCTEGTTLNECLMEDHECSIPRQCPLHPYWSIVREQFLGYLERTTLADLVRIRQSDSGESSSSASAMLSRAI